MNLIERYIFGSVTGSFLGALMVLTGLVWVTQALREIDLVTSQGQTLWLFLYITVLALPALLMVTAPIALFIACLYVLNKLNADSELVVVNAAGVSPWHVVKPFVTLGVLVTVLTAVIAIIVLPESARTMRGLTTQIRADLLNHIVVEGRFTTVGQGLTFHVRERHPDGTLLGLVIHDARDSDRIQTYLAEEGHILRDDENAYLVMRNGSVQQVGDQPEHSSIVTFNRYVFDLSILTQRGDVTTRHPQELHLFELLKSHPNNYHYQRAPERFITEFHNRLSGNLYPLAFVLVALAALGRPQTNRDRRGRYLLLATAVVAALRGLGFGAISLSQSRPWALALLYLLPLAGIVGSIWAMMLQRSIGGRSSLLAAAVTGLLGRLRGPTRYAATPTAGQGR